jgi:hypothetical protein
VLHNRKTICKSQSERVAKKPGFSRKSQKELVVARVRIEEASIPTKIRLYRVLSLLIQDYQKMLLLHTALPDVMRYNKID